MNEKNSLVVCVGEVTIELARGGDGHFSLGYGGDTFNTAVYLARAGLASAFVTALGDDVYSDGALGFAGAEGVATDLIVRVPGRLPGITLIDTDSSGGQRHDHWHERTPARELFELPDWSRMAEGMLRARLIYFSGITLSLFSNVGLGRFLATIELARKNGAKVAFDGNFRPRGWKGDLSRTRAVFMEALKRVDLALPTYDDEAVLWGDPSPEATLDRIQAFGVTEIAVKNGPNSALVAAGDKREFVPVPDVVVPVDVTAAGDGFNAGYLASRLSGSGPTEAAAAAHKLAGEVIKHRGAIVPRASAAMH